MTPGHALKTGRAGRRTRESRGSGRLKVFQMSEPVVLIVAIVLCLLGNGFFSGSEIAVISARRSQVEALIAEGSRAARRLKHLQDNLDDFLATVQIGVTLMGTLAGVLGGYLAKLYVEPCWSGAFRPGSGARARRARLIVGRRHRLRRADPGRAGAQGPGPALHGDGRPCWSRRRSTSWRGSRTGSSSSSPRSTRAVLALFRIRDLGHRTFVSEEEIKHLVQRGPRAGRAGPDRDGADPQRVRVLARRR